MSNKYVEQILTAMEIISNAQINQSQRDITIQAKIKSKTKNDEVYSIEYQGAEYQGVSGGKDYSVEDIVFVTCPNGISGEEKIIIGKKSVQEELIEDILDQDNDYINVGSNIIKDDGSFDTELLQGLLPKIDGIRLSAEFTATPENINEGLNYGIKLTFDNNKTFVLDINDMIGYPYYYPTATTQEKIILKDQIDDSKTITSCEFFTDPEGAANITANNISIFAIIERNKITQDEVLVINRSNTHTLENNESQIRLEAFLISKDEGEMGAYSWEVKSKDSEEWVTLLGQTSQTIDLSPTTVWAKNYQIRGVVTLGEEEIIYSEQIDIVNKLGLTVNVSREEDGLVIDSWDQYTGVVAYLWQVKDVHGQIMPDKERKFRGYPIDPTKIEISNEYIGSAFVNGVYIGSDSEFVTQVIPPEPAIPPAKIYSLSLSNDREMVAITSSGKPLASADRVIAATAASVWADNLRVTDAVITLVAPNSFYTTDENNNKVLNSDLIAFNNGKLQLYGLPTETIDSYTFIFEYTISEGNVLQEDFIVKKFASEEDYSLQVATPVVNLTTNPTGTIMFYVTRRDTNGLTKLPYDSSKDFISATDADDAPILPSGGSSSIEHKISYNKDTVFPVTITLTVNDIVWDEEEIEAVKNGNKGDGAIVYTMELTNEKDILLVEKSTGLARDGELSEAATGIQILKNEKNIFNSEKLSISNSTDFVFDSVSNKVKLNKTKDAVFTDAQQFSTEIYYKINDNLTLTKTFTVTTESDFEHEYFLVLPISVNENAPSVSWKVCKDNSNTVASTNDNCTLEIFEGDGTTASDSKANATFGSYTLKTDVSKVRFKLSTNSGDSKYIWDEEEVSIIKNGKTPVKGEDYSDGIPGDSVVDEQLTAYWNQQASTDTIPPALPSSPTSTTEQQPSLNNSWNWTFNAGSFYTYKSTITRKKTINGATNTITYSWSSWSAPEIYAYKGDTSQKTLATVQNFLAITNNGDDKGIYYTDESGKKITDLKDFDPATGQLLINATKIRTGLFEVVDDGGNSRFSAGYDDSNGNPYVQIAGFYVTNDSIYSDGKSSYNNTNNGVYLGIDGISLGSKFFVDKEGNITAKSGTFKGDITGASGTFSGKLSGSTIEGSTIYGSTLIVGNKAGIRSDNEEDRPSLVISDERSPVRFWSGLVNTDTDIDYTFVVLEDGSLYATAAKFKGANVTIDDTVHLGDQTVSDVKQEVSTANNNANSAVTTAGEAKTAAITAQNSATASATAAAGSASAAAESEGKAAKSATDADTAKTGAEAAQGKAEEAQAAAKAARDTAVEAKNAAVDSNTSATAIANQAKAEVEALKNAGYITKTELNEKGYQTSSEVDTKVQTAINNSGHATKGEVDALKQQNAELKKQVEDLQTELNNRPTQEEVDQQIQDALGSNTPSNNSYSEETLFEYEGGETEEAIVHYLDMNYLASYGGGAGGGMGQATVSSGTTHIEANNYNTSTREAYLPIIIGSGGYEILQINIYCQVKIGGYFYSPYNDLGITELRLFESGTWEGQATYAGNPDPTTSKYIFRLASEQDKYYMPYSLNIDAPDINVEAAFLVVSKIEIVTTI